MDRSSSLPSAAAAAIPVPESLCILLNRGPPAGSARVPAGNGAAGSAEAARHLTEDHDRIAGGMNDIVVHRLFSAGLALQGALRLMGGHPGAGKVQEAIGQLDLAIRDIRNELFDHHQPNLPSGGQPG